MLQLLPEDYSLTCPPPGIGSFSFIQLNELGRRAENENDQLQNSSKGIRTRVHSIESGILLLSYSDPHINSAIYNHTMSVSQNISTTWTRIEVTYSSGMMLT